jgi:N utilization substance protein B
MPKPIKQRHDTRHEARKLALQTLFEASFHDCDLLATAARIRDEMVVTSCDDELLTTLLNGIGAQTDEIDKLISRCAPEWPIEQLPRVDLNILRIAIFELYIARSVPPKVAIDEAVELAKEFGTDSTSSFVNGALGTVIKMREKDLDTESALLLGHFQPLHRGHLAAIRQIASRFPKVVIGILDADAKHTGPQPLSGKERRQMIQDVLSTMSLKEDEREVEGGPDNINFQIVDLPAKDDPELVPKTVAASPRFAVVYTNDERLAARFQAADIPVFGTRPHKPEECNSIEIRRSIILGHAWNKAVPFKVERYLKERKIVDRMRHQATVN